MSIENEIAVLGNKLEHIDAAINKMNNNVDTILDKLNQQNGDLIKAEKDIEFLKKEAGENKAEHEKEIEILWQELRRRDEAQDKKFQQREVRQRWVIGTIISLGFLGMVVLKYFG